MGYDLVIKNGHVVDGTGRPRFKANIYVDEGKIAKVSTEGPEYGDEVIDAEGMIVCPGFLDMHSHADLTLFGNKRAESFIRQGATTLYFTPDGWSPAPVVEKHRKDLKNYYKALAFGASLPFNWTTYDDYFNKLEEGGLGVNVRANVGFGTVRIDAMGFEMREPSRYGAHEGVSRSSLQRRGLWHVNGTDLLPPVLLNNPRGLGTLWSRG